MRLHHWAHLWTQEADDKARNGLFVIAILLSTAAACVVAAMQVILRGKH